MRLWEVASGECRAIVENLPDPIYCVAWCTSSDGNYLVTGSRDGSVLKWKVIEGGEDPFRVHLQWSASHGALTVTGASIQGAHGLTGLDKQLLKQQGANGEPDNLLREPGQKLITMAPVVSTPKETSEGTTEEEEEEEASVAHPPPVDLPEKVKQPIEHHPVDNDTI